MTSPSDTAAGSSPKEGGAAKQDDAAWGAETDFDSLEKEASKIFAVWELADAAAAPTPASADPLAAGDAKTEEKETWVAAREPVAAAPVAVAPPAETASVIIAPEPAAPMPAARAMPKPAANAVAAAMAAPAAAKVAPAAAKVAPAALPDVPAAVPVRASQRPAAAAMPPSAMRIEHADPVTLPSTPPYTILAAAAVAVLGLIGVGAWVLGGGRSHDPPPSLAPSATVAPSATTVAAAPSSVAPPPSTLVAVAPVAAPASAAVVAPVPAAPPSVVAVAPLVPPAPVAVTPPPPPPTPTHRLRVAVTPSDATLTLDGTQVVNPLDRQVDEGSHQIVASRDGYAPETQTVDANHDRTVQVRLRALPPPPAAHREPVAAARPTPPPTAPRLASRVAERPHAPAHPAGARTTGRRSGGSTLVTESPY